MTIAETVALLDYNKPPPGYIIAGDAREHWLQCSAAVMPEVLRG
jgi:hypothetical protein